MDKQTMSKELEICYRMLETSDEEMYQLSNKRRYLESVEDNVRDLRPLRDQISMLIHRGWQSNKGRAFLRELETVMERDDSRFSDALEEKKEEVKDAQHRLRLQREVLEIKVVQLQREVL